MAVLGAVSSFPLLGRHISFALPALAVIVALGTEGGGRRIPQLMAAAVVALALFSLVGFWLVDAYAKEDLRQAADIAGNCTEADIVWAANPNGAAYYLPDVPVRVVTIDQVTELPASTASETVIFVLNNSHYDPQQQTADALLDARSGYLTRSFAGVSVIGPRNCVKDTGTPAEE